MVAQNEMIGSGFVNGVQVFADSAHGPYPAHMDVRIQLDQGLCQKLRVDGSGNIMTDDLEVGNRFLKDNAY